VHARMGEWRDDDDVIPPAVEQRLRAVLGVS
jgi:hypothetical protein